MEKSTLIIVAILVLAFLFFIYTINQGSTAAAVSSPINYYGGGGCGR